MTRALTDFFAAWSETGAEGRAALVRSATADDFYYADPHAPAPIRSADDMLEFLGQFPPGARAEVIDPVDSHHGHARANVRFVMGGNEMVGQYFADLDAEGRIARIVGFPGKGAE